MQNALQKNKVKGLRSSWPGKGLKQKLSAKKSLLAPVILLRSCDTVNMGKFKACLCDGDLGVLRVSGAPTPLQLLEAWQSLFLEYCDLTDNPKLKEQLLAPLKLQLDKRLCEVVSAWVKIAKVYKSEEICKCLSELYPVHFDMEDDLAYRGALAEIQAELINLGFDIRVREAELAARAKTDKDKKKIDRKYFATIFFRINNYAKREAVNDQTFVTDYVVALKCYDDYIENLNTA